MAKTRKQKTKLLEEYKKLIEKAGGVIVIKPSKVTAEEASEFRKEMAKLDAKLNIVKNSIMRRALAESNLPAIESLEFGEHAVLFLKEDIITPSKALKKFIESTTSKDGKAKVQIVAGILNKALLTALQASELAEMPDKKGSVAAILCILESSISSILNVVEDPIRGYMSIIDQSFK